MQYQYQQGLPLVWEPDSSHSLNWHHFRGMTPLTQILWTCNGTRADHVSIDVESSRRQRKRQIYRAVFLGISFSFLLPHRLAFSHSSRLWHVPSNSRFVLFFFFLYIYNSRRQNNIVLLEEIFFCFFFCHSIKSFRIICVVTSIISESFLDIYLRM